MKTTPISSPGDVAIERDMARKVVESLRKTPEPLRNLTPITKLCISSSELPVS